MQQTQLLLRLALAASLCVPVTAQNLGSRYDPQISELMIEGRVPFGNLLSETPNVLALPETVLAALRAGNLELRARLEYNRGARIFRVYQMITPTNAPLASPAAPSFDDPSVGSVFDMSIDYIAWYDFRSDVTGTVKQVATVVGKRLGLYKGSAPLDAEPIVLEFSFDKGSPERVRMLTLTVAGVLAAVAPNPVGYIRLDPPVTP